MCVKKKKPEVRLEGMKELIKDKKKENTLKNKRVKSTRRYLGRGVTAFLEKCYIHPFIPAGL